MATVAPFTVGEDVHFERDAHAYVDLDGTRIMSLTQAITIAGLIDYRMVPQDVLEYAAWRGRMVHQACAVLDQGWDLSEYEIPPELEPYIEAYSQFTRDMRFRPDPNWIEQPMIVTLFGHRVATTPDVVGTIDGVPTVVERKVTATKHASWAIQTAGQAMALRAVGIPVRQRMAVQLLKTGRYHLDPHDEPGDFDTFADTYRLAKWKVKNNLAKLA
jgi:hypothetical protein